MDNTTVWKVIDKYFEDNPQALVRHHIESYNDFFKQGIFQIFKEKNPIKIQTRYDKTIDDYRSKCIMYLGGKDGSKIYFGKPVIYDDNNAHFMYPNEARLRNMTYGITIHYDIDIEFIDILEDGESPTLVGSEDIILEETENDIDNEEKSMEGGTNKAPTRKNKVNRKLMELTPAEKALFKEATAKSMDDNNRQIRQLTLEKVFLGRFPIMLQSNHCILSGLPKEIRHTMGECSNDYGGYFIIDGKEKTVVSQEKFGDNMLYIREVNDDTYLYSAEIRSVSENVSKPIRTLSVKIMAPTSKFTFKNIVVNIPNVRKPVPLFIVFRALGFISDKQIITMCLLDLDKHEDLVDLFVPSVHDSGGILTQRSALKYIATLTKGKTVPHTLEILADYFLPHIGEINFTQKAYYLGYIVFQLLLVYIGTELPTDRDNFKYKRIELVGSLMYDLFREYYTMQQKSIHLRFEEKIFFNQAIYADNLYGLIQQEHKAIFDERILEKGFKKAFKGNWGAQAHTKRIGVVQDLNRLTHNSMLSHLRKTNLPLDASVKVVGPRVLHNTQWGFFDPIDTPDGGNIGLHKHLSIGAYISQGYSRDIIIKWLREKVNMKLLEECTPLQLSALSKIVINGYWAGAVQDPIESIKKIKLFRRNGLIPIYTSVTFETKSNTIFMYTDGGRICRPIFYRDDETGKMSYDNKNIKQYLDDDKFSWNELIAGFNRKKVKNFNPNTYNMYELHELYENIDAETNPAKLNRFIQEKAIIDYIDTNETEGALIAMNKMELEKAKMHTHVEIHESLIFGTMCNLINFLENNPATRNSFSCGQSKQACSMYHTNHQVRMDKTAVVLNYAQNALVKSRYLKHINNEENPYGENVIVAVMCYTGYNVEDAILLNEGALNRGMFRTTYYSTYEMHEEKTQTSDSTVEQTFSNIEDLNGVIGTKPGFDYSKLDKHGLVKENTELNDKTVLIGYVSSSSTNPEVKTDGSKTPKKGQLGIVDKTFITDGEEGTRIAKVRVREERIPNLGDKLASRAGQKGTVGLVIPEKDMPFNKDGIRPDIIINPHALPSRMTIGQFVETITGKACASYGGFGDCTAFNNDGSKVGIYGDLLCKSGYHSSGNEILYNGMTGEQLEVEIFMGPNYYMRLKHMVKDKINYRASGKMTALTKQPVSGRANDGGLRIGEMERDGVISHGASAFLKESMMERADKYRMAICNTTGLTAIYNPSKNLFLSPMADGPIKFSDTVDNNKTIETVSKFGRNFSIIDVPYSFKLLIQELQTMNVQMRIITEDNINQLETMTFSNNLNLLMKNEFSDPNTVNNTTNKILKDSESYNMNTPESIKTPESMIQDMMSKENIVEDIIANDNSQNLETPPYPGSPEWPPTYNNSPYGSPEYKPKSPYDSPVYNPNSPYVSPVYNPNSPYVSPVYNPNSPNSVHSGHSPDYSPEYATGHSPDYPPDYYDSVANNIEYNMGDYVHFRGDLNPKRIWSVKNIGDKFITIETDDTNGLDSSDRIKVVTENDIYKLGDYTYSSPNIGPIYDTPVNSTNDNDVKIGENNTTPAINIKIVNGNDLTEPSSMHIDTNIDNTDSSPMYAANNIPTPIKMKSSIVENDDSPIETPIDFKKNIIIKKI